MQLTFEDLKRKSIAIKCNTNEESILLFKKLGKYSRYFNFNYIINGTEICYSVEKDGSWSYCNIDYYKNDEDNNWRIIEFRDLEML